MALNDGLEMTLGKGGEKTLLHFNYSPKLAPVRYIFSNQNVPHYDKIKNIYSTDPQLPV